MNFDEFTSLVENRGGSVSGKPALWKVVSVDLRGIGSKFEFGKNCKIENLSVTDYGGKNSYRIDENSKLSGIVKAGKNCQLAIGKNFSVTAALKLHLSEGADIIIGDNCMFGINVNIYNHDYHPIFSRSSGERLNRSETVVIANNVWLANNVTILKGCVVNTGSVIGIGSIASGEIPEYCIAAGSPARVIKRDIVWDRASLNTTHPDGIDYLGDL